MVRLDILFQEQKKMGNILRVSLIIITPLVLSPIYLFFPGLKSGIIYILFTLLVFLVIGNH